MGLNKAGGEMYPWADWTYNPLGGACPHDCSYCYMKRPPVCWSEKYKGPQRVWEKEMKTKLSGLGLNRREELDFVGTMPVIFVCSGNDLGTAPMDVKRRILKKCSEAPDNWYLLQSKAPKGFLDVEEDFPPNVILGTTIETNNADLLKSISKAPSAWVRVIQMTLFSDYHKMVSVEPMLACDPKLLALMIREIDPDFVSLGADSKAHDLPEPSREDVLDLIHRVEEFTFIKKKGNLDRLLV